MKSRFTSSSVTSPFRSEMVPAPKIRKYGRQKTRARPILVISEDMSFTDRVCRTGKAEGLMIVQASHSGEALRQLKAARPAAVLLDLDLPHEAAWGIADRLLQEESCPQLVLLTERMGHFDLEAASRAGSVMDKTVEPSWLLEVLSQTPKDASSAQTSRNAVQRVLIRWLRPCEWPVPAIRAQRWWGINE